MRLAAVGSICLSVVGLSLAAESWASIKRETHVEAQKLGPALELLAKEHQFQVLYRTELVVGRRAEALEGSLTTDEALRDLLSGSGLTYRYLGERAITIVRVGADGAAEGAGHGASLESDANSEGAQKSDFWERFRLAQADQRANPQSSTIGSNSSRSPGSSSTPGIEEIVVTAQKREERLQDVPVPVTAITGQSLVEQNQLRLEDYFSSVPGLNFASGDRGELYPSIRGLTTGNYSNPTVGIVIDDVPYGASAAFLSAPDIDPSDLARIEVLRGPQGTLYGVSSLGGLIKYVTIDPSVGELTGRIEAGTDHIQNGAELGYSVRGAMNVPLSDAAAARLSGYSRREPGYIDNPVRGLRGLNDERDYGGRVSLLWRPADMVSLKFGALLQRSKAGGNGYTFVEPGFRALQQDFLPGVGGYQRAVDDFSLTARATVANVDITSITGYIRGRFSGSVDLSSVFGSTVQPIFGVNGSAYFERRPVNKLSQEIRLSGEIGRVGWLLGGFYTDESGEQSYDFPALDSATGATAGNFGSSYYPYKYQEIAVFTDVTFHITEKFDVQVGGRQSHDRQPEYEQIFTDPYARVLSIPNMSRTAGESANPFTYLLTPRFRISPDLMVYIRVASGFRPGGGNSAAAIAGGAPSTFAPDKTQNYELGFKGSVLARALTYDISVYRINWNDIQASLFTPIGQTYYANAGQAKSQGVELSLELKPFEGATINAWSAWNDAVLTRAFPAHQAAFGVPGNRLPYGSRFSGNLSAEQEFRLAGRWRGVLGTTLSYVGDRVGNFQSTPQRQLFPGYAKVDFRVGVKSESWTASFFVNNVADRRGEQGGGIDGFPAYGIIYIQPRTAGLTLSRTF